jgi:hypothetical protein
MGDLWLTQWHCDRFYHPVNNIRPMVHTHLYSIIAAIGRTSGRSLRTFKQTGRRWREKQFHAVLMVFVDVTFQLPSSNIAFPFPACYGGTSNDTVVNGESMRVVQTDRQTDNKNREGCAPCDKLRLPGDRLSPFWLGRRETEPSHRVRLV